MKIDLLNYEAWMAAYIDGELTNQELKIFNQFLEKHPALKEELVAYNSTKFIAEEDVVFENKNALYKKETASLSIKKIWPIAAAILILLSLLPLLKEDDTLRPKNNVAQTVNTSIKVKKAPSKMPNMAIVATPKTNLPATTKKQWQPKQAPIKAITSPKNATEVMAGKTQNGDHLVEVPEQSEKNQNTSIDKIVLIEKETIDERSQKQEIHETVAIIKNTQGDVAVSPAQNVSESQQTEKEKALIVISKETTPELYSRINEVANKIENNIETIKELKNAQITVSIGKQKLFTINN